MALTVYRTRRGMWVECDRGEFELDGVDWDELFSCDDPGPWLSEQVARTEPAAAGPPDDALLPPIKGQEVWAAGVTYYRSRSARMEESAAEGDFYDRVYSADRPELFFKASPHRVVGHGGRVRIRSDSTWNVPEPELAVCISTSGRIFGATIGDTIELQMERDGQLRDVRIVLEEARPD